jgi:hypothetical protein
MYKLPITVCGKRAHAHFMQPIAAWNLLDIVRFFKAEAVQYCIPILGNLTLSCSE